MWKNVMILIPMSNYSYFTSQNELNIEYNTVYNLSTSNRYYSILVKYSESFPNILKLFINSFDPMIGAIVNIFISLSSFIDLGILIPTFMCVHFKFSFNLTNKLLAFLLKVIRP